MVNPITLPLVIAAKIHKYFSRFENAGATSSETSKTLQSFGLDNSILFKRLLRKGIFIQATPGNYYVSRANYDKFRAKRRVNIFLILGIIVLALLIFSYFCFF